MRMKLGVTVRMNERKKYIKKSEEKNGKVSIQK